MIIASHLTKYIDDLEKNLSNQFGMIYLGKTNLIIGMHILRDCKNGLHTYLRENMCPNFFKFFNVECSTITFEIY